VLFLEPPAESIVQLLLGELEGSVELEVILAAIAASHVINLVVTVVVELHVLTAGAALCSDRGYQLYTSRRP
jgi:hypothetical protein